MAAFNYPHPIEDYVLKSEGGYTNNPQDPGGPTNWGVTIYDARLYWKHDATAADVKAMPLAVAQDIYRRKYWDALACDALPSGLDYVVADYGINSGVARSGKVLRQCMGLAGTDWHVTPAVIEAIGKRDVVTLIQDIDAERLRFLESLRTWPEFGKGWGARVRSVNTISLHLYTQKAAPLPPPHVANETMPMAKAVPFASDLFLHLSDAADWPEVWNKISALAA